MLEDDNILCDVCKMKQQHSESILELKFEIFDSKEDMKKSIEKMLQNNPKDIYSKNQQYSSNVVHELVYFLVNNQYKFKKNRMKYIWGLEIISEKQEFPDLLKDLNCNLETPEDVFIRKSNIKNQKILNYIHNIIKISENRTITAKQNNFKSFQMTNMYHNLQEKIFDYLKENYDQAIRKCKNCKEIIYIFGDLEKIGKLMKLDKAKDDICLLYTSPSPRDRQKSRMPSSA